MNDKKGLLGSGFSMVARNKRYIFWFWLFSVVLAGFGTAGLRESAHAILDHSLYAQKLTHGFDLSVYIELLLRPEFGTMNSMDFPALYFAFAFLITTALFLPGVFAGYASTYRLPREDFFRACGRNLWRFIRIMIIAGIVMGIFAGILFAANGAIVKKAGESTNEVLPFELKMTGLAIIFLVMTTLRIWFDLAEADTVLNDQRAVRKSIATAFRHTFRGFGHLLGSYVLTTIVAAVILLCGLLAWMKLVSPESILGAFIMSQITLFLLLIPRFWQRGIAVSYWQQHMLVPVVVVGPIAPAPTPVPLATDLAPESAPTVPTTPATL
jgi:NADH:ubiquinone oxidoreductase subunit 6 (subunit J)